VTPRSLLLLLVSIVLGACGQLLFKGASRSLPALSESGLGGLLLRMFSTPAVLGGFACFFISAVLWIAALKQTQLSIAYPMVALSYIIIFAGSHFIFGEPLNWRHWAGAALILGGIWLIAAQR